VKREEGMTIPVALTITDITDALVFILPAYCTNAAPVIFGGGRPIDGGRRFLDGQPILGAHKTVRGAAAGLTIGTLVSLIQSVLLQYSFVLGLVTSIGAVLGDLAKSFFKRRLRIPPGSPFPVADQLDFVLGAILMSLLVSPPPLKTVMILLVLTPILHVLTNCGAYLLGLKKTMW